MPTTRQHHARRLSFLGLIAWLSVCLLIAGLFPHMNSSLNNLWICIGLFGLVSAVGLTQGVKSEMQMQQKMLETYISEARTDSLTGLANRRAFELELDRNSKHWQEDGKRLSLLLMDLDQFRIFNDENGHQAGDEMLRAVARVLERTMHGIGMVSRFGGQEFGVLMPGTSLSDAKSAAEHIRSAVSNHASPFRGDDLRITSSVGVVEAMPAETPHELVVRADATLFAAKEGGRNCAYYHDGERSQPIPSDKYEQSSVMV